MTVDRCQGASPRTLRMGGLAVLAGGIVLGLLPNLAFAADVASAPSDLAAGTSTAPDPAATGGASTDPAQSGVATADPSASPPASPTDATGASTTGSATDPGTTTSTDPAPATTDPATADPAASAPTVATSGQPIACSPAADAASGCPTLVLEQAQPAAPAPEQPPAQAPPPAPAPSPAPTAAPAAPVVTHLSSAGDVAPGSLAPLHGTVSPTERPAPATLDGRPAVEQQPQQAAPAPVLTAQPPPVLLRPEPQPPRLGAAEPRRDSVVLRPVALHDQTGGAGAPILKASLEPLLKSAATHVGRPAADRSTRLGSTGGDEPLPLPPRDPSESPTGLGAPSSGGGQHGSTGVFAIVAALVLLFVPRMVRRLPRVGAVAPRVGYRLVLERPG